MSICDGCIHDDVCGLEDNHEEGIVSCADRIPKDVLDKIRAEIEQLRNDFMKQGGIYEHSAYGLDDALVIIGKIRNEVNREADN